MCKITVKIMQPSTPNLVVKTCGRVVKSCKDLDSEPVTNNAFSCKTGHLAPVHYKRESYIQCLTSHGI